MRWITIKGNHILIDDDAPLKNEKKKEEGLKSVSETRARKITNKTAFLRDKLEKQSDEWFDALENQEKHLVRKYTANSLDDENTKYNSKFFRIINRTLDGENVKCFFSKETILGFAETISNAIRKFAIKENIVCYRAMGENEFKSYIPGETIKINRFLSTTINSKKLMNREYKAAIRVPAGAKGAYLGKKASRMPHQQELLLDKGTRFIVISKKGNELVLGVIKDD